MALRAGQGSIPNPQLLVDCSSYFDGESKLSRENLVNPFVCDEPFDYESYSYSHGLPRLIDFNKQKC